MLLYAGKDSSIFEGSAHGFNNPTAKVVVELMDGFLDVGHLLAMDNWYKQLVLTLAERHVERGDQIARHCGDVSMVAWKDVKLVTLISTFHSADRVDGHRAGEAQRKPAVVVAYNKTMGGVDLKDQKLSQYFFERKRGRKWKWRTGIRLGGASDHFPEPTEMGANGFHFEWNTESSNDLMNPDVRDFEPICLPPLKFESEIPTERADCDLQDAPAAEELSRAAIRLIFACARDE
ncbi:transposase IS4 domain-containing protein [Phthorimaea operculella]|nr:transposase IS4 domain-containing protein [Phthorimaea operculella]